MTKCLGLSLIWIVSPLLSSAEVPGDNRSSTIGWNLQRNVYTQILAKERAFAPNCKRPHVIRAMISGSPNTLNRGTRMGFAKMQWDERWTVDRCGTSVFYLVHFDMRGSIGNFKIESPPRS